MKRIVLATVFGAATALLVVASQANASVVLYSDAYAGYGDYAAFQAATHSTAYNFANVPSAAYDSLQVGPATFTSMPPQQVFVGPSTDGINSIGLLCGSCTYGSVSYINFKPSDQSHAVGVLIDQSYTQGSEYRVFINGVEFASPATDPGYAPEPLIEDGGHLFYGFVSDVPIATLEITSHNAAQGAGETLIQFNVGAPAETAVPEPASWTMMVGGIGLVVLGIRRRRIIACA